MTILITLSKNSHRWVVFDTSQTLKCYETSIVQSDGTKVLNVVLCVLTTHSLFHEIMSYRSLYKHSQKEWGFKVSP